MVIFWDEYGILLSEDLPDRTTIIGPYYSSIIQRLCYAIVEKGGGNAPVDKCNIVQAAIWKSGFAKLNDGAHSADIAPSDCHSWINLFMSVDDERIDPVDEYLNKLDCVKASKVCVTCGSVKVSTLNKCHHCSSTI